MQIAIKDLHIKLPHGQTLISHVIHRLCSNRVYDCLIVIVELSCWSSQVIAIMTSSPSSLTSTNPLFTVPLSLSLSYSLCVCLSVCLSLCLFEAVYPSGDGSVTRVLLLQSSRSSTSTAWCEVQADEILVFIHLFLAAFPAEPDVNTVDSAARNLHYSPYTFP